MSSKSAASKKRQRSSKGSTNTAAGAATADDSSLQLQADPTAAAAADGLALDANAVGVGADGDDAASAALRSAKARKLHVGDAASDEAAAAAAAAAAPHAADEQAAATNDATVSHAHAASAPFTPAAAIDGAAATADAASAADARMEAASVAASPAAAAAGLSVATPASSATPSRSPTPAQASPSSALTAGAAGAPKSPSVPTPSPTAGLTNSGGGIVVSPLPPLPAGMNRGYVAQYYWSHYPPAAAATIPAALLPQFSDVVASIPAIFQQIISTLQALEQTVHNRDILAELDRKIIKPLTPKEADAVPVLDRKLVLKSSAPGATQDYLIHACRRENVKLVFASPEEGGLIGKLGLCPMLIDLFMVQAGGKKQLQAGVGGLRYGPAALAAAAAAAASSGKRGSSGGAAVNIPEKGADYKCSCGNAHNGEITAGDAAAAAVKTEKSPSPRPPTDRTPAASPARKSRAAAAAQAAEAEPAAVDEPAGRDTEMHDDPPQLTANTAPAAAASSATSTARRVPGSGSDGRGTSGGAFRSPPASGSAHNAASIAFATASDGHALGPATSNCLNCNATNKKMAKQAKQLEKMKEELKAVHEERSLWEQKFNDEKDHNIRLFEKILLVQQQLRNMSRPLGVSLTHAMNHIATPSMQAHVMQAQQQQQQQLSMQQQQQNALAAQAQAQAQAQAAAQQQAQLVAQHQGQQVYALTHDGLPVAHGLPHPHALHPHLLAVDPYHAHSTAVMPLSSAQLAEHLHTSEMTSNYPINVQQQLAEQRSRQQMEMRQEAEIRQQQQQMQQQVRA